MRSRVAIFFECKVRYEKVMEDGVLKKVTETYVVDAVSFGEAEKRIIEEMSHYTTGELTVANLKIAQYKEVFFDDRDIADKWYKVKLAFITIDEKTDKEKKSNVFYLLNAHNIDDAILDIQKIMGGTMIDYYTYNVSETPIMDVFEYKPQSKQEETSPDNGDDDKE